MRTAWRMLITHKRLLQWNPSGDSDRSSRTDLVGSYRTMWIGPVVAAAAAITLAVIQTGRAGCGRAHTGPLVCLPRNRLVDQPAARPAAKQADSGSDSLSAEAFPENLGVLRDFRRPGRSLAAARQLSGAPGLPWSRTARRPPTWALRCWRICPRTTSAIISAGQLIERTAQGTPHHGRPGTTPGPLLQLVRHAISETAAASLHFVGGQRESRRPSADIARRVCSSLPTRRSWARGFLKA